MTYLIKPRFLLLAIGLTCSPTHANDLFDILQLALENDPVLQQAEASYRANRETMIQTRSALLPNLGASASTTRLTSGPPSNIYDEITNPVTGETSRVLLQREHSFSRGVNNHNWGISLNQSLLNLSNWYNLQGAIAADRAAAVQLAAQEQELIVRVTVAYFDVLRARDTLEVNIQEEEAAQRSLEQASQREAVGLVPITDVYDAQAAYDLARNITILQTDFLRSQYEVLEAITGQAHPEIDVLRDDFPSLEVDGSLAEWEDQAMKNSLALAAAEFNLQASRRALQARKSDRLPTIGATGRFDYFVTQPIVSQGIQIGGGASERSNSAAPSPATPVLPPGGFAGAAPGRNTAIAIIQAAYSATGAAASSRSGRQGASSASSSAIACPRLAWNELAGSNCGLPKNHSIRDSATPASRSFCCASR